MKKIIVTLFALSAVLVSTAMSQDSTGASDLLVNVGTVELLALPHAEHVGTYVYGGVARPIVVGESVTLLPSLSVEWSPELGHWGLVAAATVDVLVSQTVGLDAQVLLVHDQPAWQFGEAAFFAGPGVGISLYLGAITLSPSVNAFYGLSDGSWSLVPVFNVSW